MDDGQPEWDDESARRLTGAVVLVGITRIAPEGETLEQFHGTVERADAAGIRIRLAGERAGDTYVLPPDPRAFLPALPGSYRLRGTGEIVENPDFTTSWTIGPDDG